MEVAGILRPVFQISWPVTYISWSEAGTQSGRGMGGGGGELTAPDRWLPLGIRNYSTQTHLC